MQDYIKRLEDQFSLIEKGFKEEEKRAQAELATWTLDGKDIQQVHKLASKFLRA